MFLVFLDAADSYIGKQRNVAKDLESNRPG